MSKHINLIQSHLKNAYQNVILQRGGGLYNKGNVAEVEFDREVSHIYASVQSENYYYTEYDVNIYYDPQIGGFSQTCTCPYGFGCKHTVAVYLKVIDAIKAGEISLEIDPKDHEVTIDFFNQEDIIRFTGERIYEQALKLTENEESDFEVTSPGYVKAKIETDSKTFSVRLKNKKYTNQIHTSCNCTDRENPLCIHKSATFILLLKKYGMYGIYETHDYSVEREKIIEKTGLDPASDYSDIIRFVFEDEVLTGVIVKKNFLIPQNVNKVAKYFNHNMAKALEEEQQSIYGMAYVFNFFNWYEENNDPFIFNVVIGKLSKSRTKFVGNVELTEKPFYHPEWKILSDDTDREIVRLIEGNGVNGWENDQVFLARKLDNFQKIFELCGHKKVFVRNSNQYSDSVKAASLMPVMLSDESVKAKLVCKQEGQFITIELEYYINGQPIEINNEYDQHCFLVEQEENIHLWNSVYDYRTYLLMKESGEMITGKTNWKKIWDEWLRELANHVDIEIDKNIVTMTEMKVENIQSKVFLKEEGNFLLIYPAMAYNNADVHILDRGARFFTEDNEIVERDVTLESDLIKLLANSHEDFKEDTFQPFFYLSADKVLDNMWFIEFYDLCKKESIAVFGLETLKKIKYYPARPSVNFSLGSETDWFDVKLKIEYDDIQVSLSDVRKAIINKHNYVKLANGKFAMLPDEWIKRFESAIRYGKLEDDGIRLHKSQFALVHDLFDTIDNLDLIRELREKKKLLRDTEQLDIIDIPKAITANLRDYQAEGLNWLALLYRVNLGGCLADDMGLGKTLQMLALFAYAKEQNPDQKLTNLVICPTSLVYNWKNEVEKFAPSLNVKIHWGTYRDSNTDDWENFDIVITTYGSLNNDIEWLRQFRFNIATLDESQAIKNPGSLRFKAACLLNTRQRYVMTGTPIENNTIELYAQMQFLNPGILGSLNRFKQDFTITIEKEKDESKILQLKKLITPFIIRRKKEDVAKDLPEKTEQILVCEMEEEQQKVYEAFKVNIRERLMNEIESEGINKSRFAMLEGLTKLRQICDSPALLSGDEDYGRASVKADELIRHITRKIRDHKALVFSQFLGMLSLIEERLIKEGIKYVKLTGSSTKRQELVDSFENDDECRVFLISLKAGGVGLNLVSADYVFLVDPWWNPAVENQAIDRTHRIGQTKKVFAYRMICKNTIEEKIVALQEKKKSLADDIINNENGFVSQLTRRDLEMLLD